MPNWEAPATPTRVPTLGLFVLLAALARLLILLAGLLLTTTLLAALARLLALLAGLLLTTLLVLLAVLVRILVLVCHLNVSWLAP